MKKKTRKKPVSPPLFFFPDFYENALRERVVFSGNLTRYFKELVERLRLLGAKAMLEDDLWEIPQLVGFDTDKKVVVLVIRIREQDDFGESEFLISSLNNEWIAHINAYESEDDFYNHCFKLIEVNFNDLSWESFIYDDDGNYTGQLVVEDLEITLHDDTVELDRHITSDEIKT